MYKYWSIVVLLCALGTLRAQDNKLAGKIAINGNFYEYLIDECGDTLILSTIEQVTISSFRQFEDDEDYRRYRLYRRYAYKVYPYAKEAIRIFRELDYATGNMNKRQERRYTKQLQKELKEEFEDPLKQLTRTQGLILMKMIEKELEVPMYFLIKDLRNGLTASYWGTVGKLFGYDLKDGYIRGDDKILDLVLDDLDVSYEYAIPDRNVGEGRTPKQ